MQTYTFIPRARWQVAKRLNPRLRPKAKRGAAKLLQERGITPIEITDKGGTKSPLDNILSAYQAKIR
jgi:hypothetical protein